MKMLLKLGRGGGVHVYEKRVKQPPHILQVAICGYFGTHPEKEWDGRAITCERCLKILKEGRR